MNSDCGVTMTDDGSVLTITVTMKKRSDSVVH
jgi:hypothetical protein